MNRMSLSLKPIKNIIKFILPYGIVQILRDLKYRKIERTLFKQYGQELAAWNLADGNNTYRLNYDNLTSDSIVYDCGGYEGGWSQEIFCKYNANIYIFEPVHDYADKIAQKFLRNPKVQVFPFGFSKSKGDVQFFIEKDSSSQNRNVGKSVVATMHKLSDFIKENNVHHIDLIKINVEGEEYNIISDLYESGILEKISNLQIQFHSFVEDSEKKLKIARAMLSETHQQDWSFKFVFENWSIKNNG